ncbi:uncharacterized protein BDV14DRAFT_9435 [Aspergillus stella-maris]|uniref:uncharacterized protein n=1 Tax=Aspergillus stella-maris TaxID=1810926 RepID=UPI003CCE2063
MPRSNRGNSVSSCGTNPTETTPAHSSSSSSPTPIPPQTFPLALPPPKSTSNKRIRLSPRLLLQIQQLQTSSRSRATRAIPILELYQPGTFGKTISVPGREGGNTCRKVHGRDLYLTQSEEFAHLRRGKRVGFVDGDGLTNGTKPRSGSGGSGYASTTSASRDGGSYVSGSGTGSGPSSGDETERKTKSRKSKNSTTQATPGSSREEGGDIEDDIVSIIHTSPKPRSKDAIAPDAELFFPLSGLSFDASVKGSGVYSFESSNWHTKICFTWEKRPPSRSSASASEKDEGDRFVLSFSGSSQTTSLTAGRKSWLAQLTKRGISVGGLEGDAFAGGDSTWAALDGENRGGQGAGLYTLILSSALWVARGEGWV